MLKRFTVRSFSVLLTLFIIISAFSVSSYAYVDNFPNTHRNTGSNIADLIGVAKTQIGYTELSTSTGLPLSAGSDGGYTKYGASFGNPTGPWCAYFVSWCAGRAGISSSVVPRLGSCTAIMNWYSSRQKFFYRSTGYIPKAGDLAIFDWSGGMSPDHIGIVTGCSGSTFYTIEGNTGSSVGYRCEGKSRSLNSTYVIGYCVPAYNDSGSYSGSLSFAGSSKTQSIAYTTNKLSVSTTTASEITSFDAVLNGSFENGGRLKITSYGFLFGKGKKELKKYSVNRNVASGKEVFSMRLSEKLDFKLTPNTTYYYKSYITVSGVDYYGPMYAVVTVSDKPKQVSLSEKGISVGIGQTYELIASQVPPGSLNKGYTWSVEDDSVATVNNGLVTGISFGKTTVTVKTNYGNVSNTCIVDVLIPMPENINISNLKPDSVSITFDPVDNAAGYIIYRCEGTAGEPAEYKRISSKTTEFIDKVEPGKRYIYRLSTVADNEEYNSDLSEKYYVNAVPAVPSGLSADTGFLSASFISWASVPDADCYIVYRCDTKDGLYTVLGKSYTNAFYDFSAVPGITYYYKICSVNSDMNLHSGFSQTLAFTRKCYPDKTAFFSIKLPEVPEKLINDEVEKFPCGNNSFTFI